jgi:hypothetical protein
MSCDVLSVQEKRLLVIFTQRGWDIGMVDGMPRRVDPCSEFWSHKRPCPDLTAALVFLSRQSRGTRKGTGW